MHIAGICKHYFKVLAITGEGMNPGLLTAATHVTRCFIYHAAVLKIINTDFTVGRCWLQIHFFANILGITNSAPYDQTGCM